MENDKQISERTRMMNNGFKCLGFAKEGEEDKGLVKLALMVARKEIIKPRALSSKGIMEGEVWIPTEELTLFYGILISEEAETGLPIYLGECKHESGTIENTGIHLYN